MYWDIVGEEDKKMVEGWKADADRILTFVGVYLLCRARPQLNHAHRPAYSPPLSQR